MVVDPKLIEILACPRCKGELEYRQEPEEAFVCHACGLVYFVQDDIPNFLIDEARPLSEMEREG